MRHWLGLGLRLAVAGVVLHAAWAVVHRRVGGGFASAGRDLEGYNAAISWDPTNPEFYSARGDLLRDRLRPQGLDLATGDFRRAVQLNPYNWLYWGDLASALEIGGDFEAAEKAYREAVRLSPLSGYTHWNLANFLLRRGRRQAWLEALREALAREVEYQEPAIAILLKVEVTGSELDAVWPKDRASLLRLCRFLVQRRADADSDAASPERLDGLWRRLLESPEPLPPAEADFYLQYLIEEGRLQDLRSRWSGLMAHNGFADQDFSAKRNYVWDGGFESPPCDRGLCWIVDPSEDERVSWITGSGEDFSRAIRIDFLGGTNKEFRNLRQTVVVDPDAAYEFSFAARGDRISGDKGIYFLIRDPKTSFQVRTEEVFGTSSWTRRQTSFRVPSGCQTLIVDLRRDLSHRLAGTLEGTLWLDDVRLRKVESGG